MISGLLFDYGGTIDTNGIHWAVVLKRSYEKFQLDVPLELFSKAYSFGERSLAINPLVKPEHVFLDILRLKVGQQFLFLSENGVDLDPEFVDKIATDCNDFASQCVQTAKPLLVELSKVYPLVMVSNFYGNLNAVLEGFGIKSLFNTVVESAVVGVRKPDPQIYQLGVEALGFPAEECVVIGDTFSKDIVPAKAVGCQTIWLRKEGWEDGGSHEQTLAGTTDKEINDFAELRTHLL